MCYFVVFDVVLLFNVQTNARKAENFDKMFTRVPLRLTPIDEDIMEMNCADNLFEGFTFANPYYDPEQPWP